MSQYLGIIQYIRRYIFSCCNSFCLLQVDKFAESMDVLADLLKFHHHGNMPFDLEESPHQGPADLIQHRLAYIGISVFMAKLLKALVPIEKVSYYMMHNTQKMPICSLQKKQTLISLHICTGWSGPLSAYRINGYCIYINEQRMSRSDCTDAHTQPFWTFAVRMWC